LPGKVFLCFLFLISNTGFDFIIVKVVARQAVLRAWLFKRGRYLIHHFGKNF